MRDHEPRRHLLTARETGNFVALLALLAIFSDAALGHAVTWENDPYWTYWITKTFLIATVFGLGTAWIGIGAARGAIITAIHTVVLTIYYWTLSPVGLPSSPEWLDLEHTWITGLPIHFGVIYLGYLAALWLWRRRRRQPDERSAAAAVTALTTGVAITVIAGGLASLAIGDFPGFTWFLVRALLTIPFLLWWWAWAGRDHVSALAGGIVLALVWATYSHFLGPVGLPDTPLRILNPVPPPAVVEWLDYEDIWLRSFPIHAVVMAVLLLIAAPRAKRRLSWTALGAGILAAAGITAAVTMVQGDPQGSRALVEASGTVRIETGPYYSDAFDEGTGSIRMESEDMGDRVTPLPPTDRLRVTAHVQSGASAIEVSVHDPLVAHPTGEHTTWWGVGTDVSHHGMSGIGTARLPAIESSLAAFGVGNISVNGEQVARGVPVHVMTAHGGLLPGGATLSLEAGTDDTPIPGLPGDHLRVLWTQHAEAIESPHTARYIGGGLFLEVLVVATWWLGRRELSEPVARIHDGGGAVQRADRSRPPSA